MKGAWNELAATIRKAMDSEYSYAVLHWPDYCNKRLTVEVNWNGGLPIIGLEDHKTGLQDFDITACKCLDAMEAVQ